MSSMQNTDTPTSAIAQGDNKPEWPCLHLKRGKEFNLVEQIVAAISQMIAQRALPIANKMPSVRQLAKCNGISTFTVVEAYDRLISAGLLASRRGSGYFVARNEAPIQQQQLVFQASPTAIDTLTPDLYTGLSGALPVGAGWLPPEWYGEATILEAVRHAMKIPANRLRGYGHPLGFPSLRQHMASTLSDKLYAVEPDQILLTHGATHAFDLILRTLCKPGDTVFVEDPSYSNVLSLIRYHGCTPLGIPRNDAGLDMDYLAQQLALSPPKLMIVNTVLQNPLGTTLSQAQAHRLLALAEQYDFWLVEDDIYRELAIPGEASLAAMDGLRRVIRIGSFSKTLSPVFRVGSISASNALLPELARIKMLAGLTTSEINERAVYHAISARHYRHMLERLLVQLDAGREQLIEKLAEVDMKPIAKPRGGMFVSAGWAVPADEKFNGKIVADLALKAGILLSPNEFFMLSKPQNVWFRFNVAYADSALLYQFLHRIRP